MQLQVVQTGKDSDAYDDIEQDKSTVVSAFCHAVLGADNLGKIVSGVVGTTHVNKKRSALARPPSESTPLFVFSLTPTLDLHSFIEILPVLDSRHIGTHFKVVSFV